MAPRGATSGLGWMHCSGCCPSRVRHRGGMVGVSGRSLSLIDLLGELRTCDIDFYLHQQATPSGRPARWAF